MAKDLKCNWGSEQKSPDLIYCERQAGTSHPGHGTWLYGLEDTVRTRKERIDMQDSTEGECIFWGGKSTAVRKREYMCC